MDSLIAAVKLWCWLAVGMVLGGGLGFVVAAGVGASRALMVAEMLIFALVVQFLVACIVCGVGQLSDPLRDEVLPDHDLGIGA